MRTNSKFLIYLILVSFINVTCRSDDPAIIPPIPSWDVEQGVYIAGTSEIITAKVWGDDNISQLKHGHFGSKASSIFLSGDDLYVVGYEDDCDGIWDPCPTYAMLWKNGVPQPLILTDTALESRAISVFVSSDDVYVAGEIRSNNGHTIATLWINGVAHALSDGTFSASPNSVFVSNDDVYVAGREDDNVGSKAILWKNGLPEKLVRGSEATSVFVVGADVYVAGYGSSAMLWKNGVAQTLSNSDKSYALSVFVAGEDVYVAGGEFNNYGPFSYISTPARAFVWKNGVQQPLTDGTHNAIANSIAVSGDDVYVVGHIGALAIIWKNGIAKSLGRGRAAALVLK